MHDESGLKSALLKQMKILLPGFVVLAHSERVRSGVPDWSVTGAGRTTWWEFKHSAPDFMSHGIQELTCLRLAAAGYCRYVVWEERNGIKRTLIVHPKHLKDLTSETWCVMFDHRWLVNEIRKAHGV